MQLLQNIIILFTAIVTAGAGVGASTTPSTADSPVTRSSSRTVAMGASVLPDDRSKAAYDDFRAKTGRAPATWSIWSDWGGSVDPLAHASQMFPTDVAFMNDLKTHSTVPLIFWQPVDPTDLGKSDYKYSNIYTGVHDDYITQFAQAVKAYHGRVLIRFAHEMDGYWFPWGMGHFNNTAPRFVKAWRYVWQIFHDVGASNVRWVWSPNGCDCAKPTENNVGLDALYPGDKYVDYLAYSAFNWGSYKDRWTSMHKLLIPRMKGFDSMNNKKSDRTGVRKKPILIAETGSAPTGPSSHSSQNPSANTKARWITDAYNLIYSSYPRIKVVAYFNVDMSLLDSNEHWELTGKALTAYKTLLTKTKFRGRVP